MSPAEGLARLLGLGSLTHAKAVPPSTIFEQIADLGQQIDLFWRLIGFLGHHSVGSLDHHENDDGEDQKADNSVTNVPQPNTGAPAFFSAA